MSDESESEVILHNSILSKRHLLKSQNADEHYYAGEFSNGILPLEEKMLV